MYSEGAHTDAAVVDAILAVDDVVAIVDNPDDTEREGTDVHVTVTDGHDPTVTAHNVQDAVHRVTGGRVDVTIEEILER
ncbi:hypothetical protein OG579_14565 [Williamsia herbipolensis]|uniref:KEOPS complex Pcc1-like subunit n=1 Tax=Williamsia herbipolensis TaxID=1603258 RepID=A0AAU4JYX3_9NOCA|nr:hypothetical protein [Williamsia herbipolensis]